jgi:hypothetical protein
MNIARGPLTGAAVVAFAGLLLSGCAGSDGSGDKAEAPADPKAKLAASTAELDKGNYAFTMGMPDTAGKGVVHLPSKSMSINVTATTGEEKGTTFDIVLVEPDQWMKIKVDTSSMMDELDGVDLSDPSMKQLADSLKSMQEMFSGKSWMHADRSKIKKDGSLSFDLADGDVIGLSDLLTGVTTAQGDATTITGTLDATKSKGGDVFDADSIKDLGTATLDDKGRLTKLALDVPKTSDTPAGQWTVGITGYGEQAALAKPSGAVREMPDSAYEMLN